MDFQKYNIKEKKKKNKVTKIILKYIYMKFALKIRVFFGKVIVGYKNEKGVIEDLKIVFKLKKDKKE